MARKPVTITPGRWAFTPTPREGTALIKAVSETTGSEVILARAFAQPRKGEREANAALMAAAPALLQACQEALRCLMSTTHSVESTEYTLAVLRQAIAVATRDVSEVPATELVEVPA